MVVVGHIPNENDEYGYNIGERQILIKHKNGWIEDKYKERIIE